MNSSSKDRSSAETGTGDTAARRVPFIPDYEAGIIVRVGAVLLLLGFFGVSWVKTGADFGNNAYELAQYAPVLWLVPLCAIMMGGIAFTRDEFSPGYWWIILLLGVVLFIICGWVSGFFVGPMYIPWGDNRELTLDLVDKHNSVVGNPGNIHFLFYLSPFTSAAIILTALGTMLKKRN